ncbi:MAG: nucleotide exchange factor GrpE [bacterium]|nr:nucleotide exchange factor GrpE [bacterium]
MEKKEKCKSKIDSGEVLEEVVDKSEDTKDCTDNELIKIKAELEAAVTELNKQKDCLLRTAAEFDNYKKRTDRERASIAEYAKAGVIKQLLPVIDNVDRANEYEKGSAEYNKGIELIVKQLLDLTEKLGVEQIGTVGETFDPQYHEAVMHSQDENAPENSISQVMQKGYKIGETIIRPAMVQVVN